MSRVAVQSLRPGDQLHHAGDLFDVVRVQTHPQWVAVTLDERQGDPVEMVNLHGETIQHQPLRTVLYGHPGIPVRAECQVVPS